MDPSVARPNESDRSTSALADSMALRRLADDPEGIADVLADRILKREAGRPPVVVSAFNSGI